MEREKLRELLRRRPFQPFRVHLTNGQTHDALLPNMHLLGETYIRIGYPEPDIQEPYCDYSVIVMLSEIARIELLPTSVGSSVSVGS